MSPPRCSAAPDSVSWLRRCKATSNESRRRSNSAATPPYQPTHAHLSRHHPRGSSPPPEWRLTGIRGGRVHKLNAKVEPIKFFVKWSLQRVWVSAKHTSSIGSRARVAGVGLSREAWYRSCEPVRVSRRLHSLMRMGSWEKRAGTHQRFMSAFTLDDLFPDVLCLGRHVRRRPTLLRSLILGSDLLPCLRT